MTDLIQLKDLREGNKKVNVKVRVLEKLQDKTVRVKKDNTMHQVATFLIADDTSTFNLTLWDDDIDRIPLKETINIHNGYVSSFGNILYLNIGRFGSWSIAERKLTEIEKTSNQNDTKRYARIGELTLNQSNLKIIGKIEEISQIRKVVLKKDNSSHEIADFLLADETGCITLSLWDEKINGVSGYNVIELDGAYITEFQKGLRLNLSKTGTIKEYEEPIQFFFSSLNVENNLSIPEGTNN
ncbi:MAG: hypothetical protein EAX96_06300 [Candidatus Lokiarchaeota archaeon]|nr:hypothetical protein [Candidatus Lokiarchaeota archaeon]